MGVMHTVSAKPFKFLVSSTTHVRKLEARANRKFHADNSFGGVGYFKGAMRPRSFVKPFKIFTFSEIIIVAYTYGNLRIPI